MIINFIVNIDLMEIMNSMDHINLMEDLLKIIYQILKNLYLFKKNKLYGRRLYNFIINLTKICLIILSIFNAEYDCK